MSLKRNSTSKAGQILAYLETHSRQSTGDLAEALGWTSTRVSAAVWTEINRPDAKIVREVVPPTGGRRTPTYVYTHKKNFTGVAAELPKPETTKPEPGKEKPAISLTDFADLLALAIAQHVVARVETHLQARLPTILPTLPNETEPISIEQLTKRLLPAEDAKPKRATVLVAGLLPNQAGIIETEFGDVFDLRFFMTDDNLKHLKAMSKSVDHVFTFTSKVSHAIEEVMVGQGHKVHRCSGGMTLLKDQLLKLYAEGTV